MSGTPPARTGRGAGGGREARGAGGGRERILAAAVHRIASDGIDDVRIARIATDARVSSALVHYHFASRELLLAEALEYSYAHAGDARISSGEVPGLSHAERLQAMVDQCLPSTPSLERDWVLWVELWLRAVRHPELRGVAEELYARMRAWFAEEIAAGVASGEFMRCDAEEVADRALALLDGFGIRTLLGDSAMPLERARRAVGAALARELGLGEQLAPLAADKRRAADAPRAAANPGAAHEREPTPSAARAASRAVRTAPSI